MTMDGDKVVFDWASLVTRVLHATRVEIVEALSGIGRPLSPSDLSKIFDEPERHYLAAIVYHVERPVEREVLEAAETLPVEGRPEFSISSSLLSAKSEGAA
jgi:hypothetical protein